MLSMALLASAQSMVEEKGLPIIENYSSNYYKAHPQNFGIAQDNRGVLYFANVKGLLEYDGVHWRTLTEIGGEPLYSLLHDGKRLWIGKENDFGYLTADKQGVAHFVSLLKDAGAQKPEFGPIWYMHHDVSNDRRYFQSDYQLFIHEGDSLRSIQTETRIRKSFLSKGVLYLDLEDQALHRMLDEKLVKVPGSDKLQGDKVQMIHPINKRKSLIITANSGFFEMGINDFGYEVFIHPMNTSLSTYFKNREVEDVLVLDSKKIAIGLYGKGLVIVEDLKRIDLSINRETGLQNDLVESLFKDKQGNLWIALNNGISKLELNFPISTFGEALGLKGTIESCLRFDTKLFAAGSEGIYSLTSYQNTLYGALNYRFEEEIPEQAWNLALFEDDKDTLLLACLNNEVISYNRESRIERVLECYPWTAKQSAYNKSLVFIGQDPGFGIVKRVNKEWRYLGDIPGVSEPIDQIFQEDEARLWLGTRSNGVYRLDGLSMVGDEIRFDTLVYFDSQSNLPEGPVKICKFNDRLLFGTSEGIYEYNQQEGFRRASGFNAQKEDAMVYRLYTAPDQRLWAIVPKEGANQFGPFMGEKNDLKLWHTPFNPIASEDIYAMFFEGDSLVWLSGPNGIFRYDAKQEYDYLQDFNVLIRKLSLGMDSVLFEGFFTNEEDLIVSTQTEDFIPVLKHHQNALSFEFAAQAEISPERQQYAYFLDGFSDDWSAWIPESKAVFTNLDPGDYVFQVKAMNIFMHESAIAEYRFSIAKPWWESNWYYFGQTLFFISLVLLTVFLNRGGASSKFAEIVALITIITVFEFVILNIEPLFDNYTGGVPVFQLLMNILLALSLNPVEQFVRKRLAKKKR